MHVVIFEDHLVKRLQPLVAFRPVFELRAGVLSLREKIEALLPTRSTVSLLVRPQLARYTSEEFPKLDVNRYPDGECWFINGRLIADEWMHRVLKAKQTGSCAYTIDENIALAYIAKTPARRDQSSDGGLPRDFFDHLPRRPVEGRMVSYPWELVHLTASEIVRDAAQLRRFRDAKRSAYKLHPGTHVLNKKQVMIGVGTIIKPGAVLDAENGPIVIGQDVTIMPNAVIEGPTFIGDRSTIKVGAKIYHGTSIGTFCKVGGEVEASVIQSYSNKQHDGFLGHSYLGSWVNIGADTNTSDLKNTYGTVRVHVDGELVDTGLQFVGLTMGDHSKTGINVMFDTGTVVGVSCNLFGAGIPPKSVPSFSWGSSDSLEEYDVERSIDTARRVMARRDIYMSAAYEELMRRTFEESMAERKRDRSL
jgi:UDP-N-acetylglucosamine diphosphorylase/glucosamine-1-phosphate N-acetyltransferase